jgi:hypothetical protein
VVVMHVGTFAVTVGVCAHRHILCVRCYAQRIGPDIYISRQWVPGTLPQGVKLPGLEADLSLHRVLRLRMSGAITPIPSYTFVACPETMLPSLPVTCTDLLLLRTVGGARGGE